MHAPPTSAARPSRSCLLPQSSRANSRDSLGEETSRSSDRRVTLINRDVLPSYSCERFYLLGELEVNAHSTKFLCDYNVTEHQEEATQDTDDLSDLENEQDLAPFVLLYLLWKPDMTGAQEFVETVILPAIKQIQCLDVAIVNSLQEEYKSTAPAKLSMSGTISPSRKKNNVQRGQENGQQTKMIEVTKDDDAASISSDASIQLDQQLDGCDDDNLTKQDISIYVIVDRLAIIPDEASKDMDPHEWAKRNDGFYKLQLELVEELARSVATHEQLRELCEGVTVGISNHERAAPGLEACVDAVNLGAADRRKYQKNNARSLMGIMAYNADELLGLQGEEQETDAVQGVLQSRVTAEWNGLGTLRSFAERAHSKWKRQNGVEGNFPVVPRKTPKRKNNKRIEGDDTSQTLEPELDERFVNVIAIVVILVYMIFHLRKESADTFWFLDPERWEDAVQRLRSL